MYAVDAFRLIEEKYREAEIFFIMGADNFINISKWKDGQKLIKKYKYIVLDRNNIKLDSYISKISDNVSIIKNENYNTCSSTMFRSMLKEEKIYDKEIIPDAVIDYIIENNLFE